MTVAAQVRDLEVRYGSVVALRGVTLEVAAGSTLAVIGPNGSGKSTLLRTLAGLERPSAGEVHTEGRPALVLQSTDVDRSVPISVRDTVTMARYASTGLFGRMGAADRQAVADAMERVGIAALASRQLHDLSGGQRQRVLVAQGLAQEADLLLLDEPITGLDVVSRQAILDCMREERERGRAVVMTTHDLADARLCDQVLLLDTEPVALGPPDEVLCEEPLRRAFAGRFLQAGGEIFLDDPHHVH